jgi:predicted glycosyltransferase
MAPAAMNSPRVLFYVQHLLGIGHLIRAARIAHALATGGFDVTMISGGQAIEGFPGEGVNLVSLPPVKAAAGFAGLLDLEGNPVGEPLKARRRDLLLSALREIEPQVLMIEAFPFGRRQMRFELLPLLEAAHHMRPKPIVVSSVRDILQETSKPGRLEETVALVREYVDLVLVHGDPNFVQLGESFPLAGRIADRIVYTGLVAGPPPQPPDERFDIVVSAGGGAAGAGLILCAHDAAGKFQEKLTWCLITGPNLPSAELRSLVEKAPPHLHIAGFRKDFASLLLAARLSISQAGYNTVCDLLQANCPSLLVPFAAGGESEQTIRAQRLARLGLAHVLTESQLSACKLAEAAEAALKSSKPGAHGLNLGGALMTREILRRRLTKD